MNYVSLLGYNEYSIKSEHELEREFLSNQNSFVAERSELTFGSSSAGASGRNYSPKFSFII